MELKKRSEVISRLTEPEELITLRNKLKEKEIYENHIRVCCGTPCRSSGSLNLLNKFREEIKQQGLNEKIEIKQTGCVGFCQGGPVVVVDLPEQKNIYYQHVSIENVPTIISSVRNKEIIDDLLYVDPETQERIVSLDDIPFFAKQKRIVLRFHGKIDPTDITDYIKLGGYKALPKALLEMSPEEIINEVKDSNLRGRGGAGFPTGIKWEFTRKAEGKKKYIICNFDEGDPGAFMNRSEMEGNPHQPIEGMIIGAYAIGASKGYIYTRSEYPLAYNTLQNAIDQAKSLGLLGKNILGSNFNFNIEPFKSAGAFVCGEETALIQVIEGKPGEPRPRPPFPANKGLWGKPTNINNVGTWANIPLIIQNGSSWFSNIGTNRSGGTKVFSLAGETKNTGDVEVPFGTTLREVIFDIGGGVVEGKFKAVQTGGPSGGVIPEQYIDTPIDYESLEGLGSIMGSGGMIVMSDHTCMIDTAHYFLEFAHTESCGKCVPCREGIQEMLSILDDIRKGKKRDLNLLNELAEYVKETSLCALGQTAPNPVLTTLKYFKDEYIEHMEEKKCRAGICKNLISFHITDACECCGQCAEVCPQECIEEGEEKYNINQEKCIKCGLCQERCPYDAIEVI